MQDNFRAEVDTLATPETRKLVPAGAQPRGTIPRLPGTPMFRALTHTRSLGIAKERKNG